MFAANFAIMLKWVTALVLFYTCAGYTQETTNALDYNYTSLYNAASASLSSHTAGITLKQDLTKGSLTYTAGVAAWNIDYKMTGNDFNTANLENITIVKLGIAYRYKLDDDWDGIAEFTPQFTSNFKNSSLKDLYPGFMVGLRQTTTGEKASELTIALGYKGYFGKFMLMPIINYHQRVNKKLSYTLGIPTIDLAYAITNTHVLKAVVFADAFYSKTGGANYIYDAGQDTNITISGLEMVNVTAGLEYNYLSQANWTGSIKAGYSFYNTLKLETPGGTNINKDLNNNIYISAGFKYNLNFK